MQLSAAKPQPHGVALLVLLAFTPLLLLGAVLAVAWQVGLPATDALPAEDLAIERVEVTESGFVVHARNVGRDPIAVGQVLVNDLIVSFEASRAEVPRLATVDYTVPFRWVEGEPYEISFVTGGGFRFSAEVAAAHPTPQATAANLGALALLGVYVGVIPVLAGLFWRPLLSRAPPGLLRFALGLTLGLLGFLALDALVEGLDVAEGLPEAFNPVVLLVLGIALATGILLWIGATFRARGGSTPLALAALVAVGIGLHNLAEGLAIGGAFALGEAALGIALVVGFAMHNLTEGLAIVSPLSGERVAFASLVGLGLVAGAPTVAGAWIGGLVASPWLALAFLAVGIGAILAVVLEIDRAWAGELRRGAGLLGAAVGFLVMYVTGLFVVI